MEQIKAKQFEVKKLHVLQNKMVHKEVEDATVDTSGVLWFKGRLYVS